MWKSTRRRLVLPATSAAALALAGAASAAVSPTLAVSSNTATVSIGYAQGAADDPPARITFLVPAGYTAGIPAQAGATVGRVSAEVAAGDLDGSVLPLAGTIVTAEPTATVTVGGAVVPLSALVARCTGAPTATSIWVATLTAAGQTLDVPIFVQKLPEGGRYLYSLDICLPPPDVPAGTPGRAAFGAKLIGARLAIDDVFGVAPGWYLWNVRTIPYSPRVGSVNLAGTVSAQSLDRTPQELRFHVRRNGRVAGRLLAGNGGLAGATVRILAGKTVLATVKTTGGGLYHADVKLPGPRTALVARATAPAAPRRDVTVCQFPAFSPAPCTSVTVGGFTIASSPTLPGG